MGTCPQRLAGRQLMADIPPRGLYGAILCFTGCAGHPQRLSDSIVREAEYQACVCFADSPDYVCSIP